MGAIGGLIGLSGGASGSGFSGPEGANILSGVTTDQAAQAYGGTQNALQQQQQLLQALQGVNGLGNQNAALQAQQALASQQQQTAGQYQNLANGVGPNPAQAQLAQNTAANVAQTGALMAGQRGASQNVGMIARQAGMQGANTQQQAAGQAATLQAQQQIAGLQGLQQQQQNIGQTNQNVAGIAGQQVGNQVGQTNANVSGNQAQYGNVLNAIGALNNAHVGMQSNMNNVNGQLANTTMQGQQGLIGGLMNGGGLQGLLAEGGEVTVENDTAPNTSTPTFGADSGADALSGKKSGGGGGLGMLALLADGGEPAYPGSSSFGQFLSGVQMGSSPNTSTPSFGSDAGATALQAGAANVAKKLKGSGKDSSSPAGDYAGADDISSFAGLAAKGGMAQKDFRAGGKVNAGPGQKAVAKGDDYANDKIPAVLSEHEIVLPRSVTLSKDPVRAAATFVQAVMAKRGKR